MDKVKIDILREALPYIKRFKRKIFVIKISGKVTENLEHLHSLAEEVALLHQVGIRIVVVHGGGIQATRLSEQLGIKPRIVNGRRITDDATLDIVKMVFAGKICTEILSGLRKKGIDGVGLSGIDGNIVLARKRGLTRLLNRETGRRETIDFGNVGDVVEVNPRLLHTLLDNDYLPVVSPLAADSEGNVFNVNADAIACEMAIGLGAEKLLMASDVDGVYLDIEDPSSLISRMTGKEARTLLRKKSIHGGMIAKLEESVRVVERGVGSVHIVNGTKRNALLDEVFTETGSGTMIVRE
ncbi:MAG: acetylglutamate kinase [Planctomycetes bacterium]|nr:acetylglutamate kinase [Planctomycetota bacterium]